MLKTLPLGSYLNFRYLTCTEVLSALLISGKQNTETQASKEYVEALRNVMDHGVCCLAIISSSLLISVVDEDGLYCFVERSSCSDLFGLVYGSLASKNLTR